VDWICPRGSQTFFLPVIADLPGTWVGSVRVESQAWWSPGTPEILAPNIVGVATLLQYGDAARTQTQQAIAYNLLPEHKAFDWQVGSAGGGTDSGVALLAVPSLLKDQTKAEVTSELSIANLVPKPGFTDFAIFIYDQNGLVDYVCQKLDEKEVEYIDLASWGYVNARFKGSAILSATFWEHDVFDADGRFLRNLVGLGAVAVQRTQARLGEDVPGDEAAGERAIPFKLPELDLLRCPFAFSANHTPLCPGLPDDRVITECTKRRVNVGCSDCPIRIQDNSTVGVQSLMRVTVPKACTVQDVNVWLSIEHPDIDNLALVQLTSPRNTAVELFSTICAGTVAGHLNVLLDDGATQRIGTLGTCPAEKFDRLNIENPTAANTLTNFEGQNPNGVWQLFLRDNVGGQVGTLLYWELQFELK
jgi:subtilisin-like proprotein convertase family protein